MVLLLHLDLGDVDCNEEADENKVELWAIQKQFGPPYQIRGGPGCFSSTELCLGRPYNTRLQQKDVLNLQPQRKTELSQFSNLFLHWKHNQTLYFWHHFFGTTCRIRSQPHVCQNHPCLPI